MNSLIPFFFESHQIRFVTNSDGSWAIVAKDVAEALDMFWDGARTVAHVPDEWRGSTLIPTPSGDQNMVTLAEQGFYFFLGRSDKPKALPFQMWVYGKVLPSIRKTGSYMVTPAPMKEDGAVNTHRQRMIVALMQFYRAFDLSHNQWTQQGLWINITALSEELGIAVPDVALLHRMTQYPLSY